MDSMREAWTDERLDDLNGHVVELGRRMDAGFAEQREELRIVFGGLRSEMRTEIGSLRSEMRTEIGSLRTEMRTEIGDLRSEMGDAIGGLRTELRGELGELRSELQALNRGLLQIGAGMIVTMALGFLSVIFGGS